MTTYNAPILHNGKLNSVYNATDMTTFNNSNTISQTNADKRYLKKTGGTLTGPLNINGNEIITNLLSTNYVLFNGNTIAQTSNQLGYITSFTNSNMYIFQDNAQHSNGISLTLTTGVYLISIQLILKNLSSSVSNTFTAFALGFNYVNNGSTNYNTMDYDYGGFTLGPQKTEARTRTFILQCPQNGIVNQKYLYACSNYNFQLGTYLQAVRIA